MSIPSRHTSEENERKRGFGRDEEEKKRRKRNTNQWNSKVKFLINVCNVHHTIIIIIIMH